jgi:drug/metabolite transporter (DMT)-like permease
MSWWIVALIAYFLLAVANLIDKFLVEKVLGSARAYTFMASIMGLLVLIVAPWVMRWPGFSMFIFDLILGGIFTLALLFLYAALRRGEASRILVLVGGSTPIFSLPLAFLVLKDTFYLRQIIAIALLFLGLLVIAFLPSKKKNFWEKLFSRLSLKNYNPQLGIILAILSGLFYALFFVGSKFAYQSQEFLSAFLWTRLGAAFFAALILFSRRARQEIAALFKPKKGNNKKQSLLVVNQGLGALGFILQNYAIYLGPVAIVNALQGVQYVWIIILGALVSMFAPKILKEDISKSVIIKKTIAILIISCGLYLLAL